MLNCAIQSKSVGNYLLSIALDFFFRINGTFQHKDMLMLTRTIRDGAFSQLDIVIFVKKR